MRKANVILMNDNEFEELVEKASNGHAGIGYELGEWFYTVNDGYDTDNIEKDLSEYLGVNVVGIRMDLSHSVDAVVIICE